MAFYFYTVLAVVIVAASVGNCSVLTEEQKAALKEKLEANVAECGPQHGVTIDQLKQWREERKGPDDTTKCFYACMFRKSGLLDNKGLYSETTALKMLKQYIPESKLEDGSAAVKACASVNEKSVRDGEAGCERAVLLFKCILEQKDLLITFIPLTFGFSI